MSEPSREKQPPLTEEEMYALARAIWVATKLPVAFWPEYLQAREKSEG